MGADEVDRLRRAARSGTASTTSSSYSELAPAGRPVGSGPAPGRRSRRLARGGCPAAVARNARADHARRASWMARLAEDRRGRLEEAEPTGLLRCPARTAAQSRSKSSQQQREQHHDSRRHAACRSTGAVPGSPSLRRTQRPSTRRASASVRRASPIVARPREPLVARRRACRQPAITGRRRISRFARRAASAVGTIVTLGVARRSAIRQCDHWRH